MDISDRKRAEERTRKQAAMLDLAQDAICLKDLNHQILFWNKGAERLYGWSAQEAIGKNAHELLSQDTPFDPKATHERVIEKGEWRGELYQVTKEGRRLVVESSWTLLRDEQGKPESILVFNIDQTERKQAGLQELRAQRLQSIGALTGGIAHDLNNALTPIAIGVSLLRNETISEDGVKMLDLMTNSIQHSVEMVKQILSFSRGVGGGQKEVCVKDLVADMVRLIQETFPKFIKIQTQVSEDLRPVMGNSTQIHQVLLNLCVNARDAMPKGGILDIATGNVLLEAESLPNQPGLNPGAYVLLKITDTGAGIPPELVEKIFEPFFTTKLQLGLKSVSGEPFFCLLIPFQIGVPKRRGPGANQRLKFVVFLAAAHSARTTGKYHVIAAGEGQQKLVRPLNMIKGHAPLRGFCFTDRAVVHRPCHVKTRDGDF
jgi:two-component system cell cycle sensor histidine kinase/response regulator CckA